MEGNGVQVLSEIKDDSISRNGRLKEYSELKFDNKKEKCLTDACVRYNRNILIFPRRGVEIAKTNIAAYDAISLHIKNLVRNEILCQFIFPELFNVFGYYEDYHPKIHKKLDYATQEEMKNKMAGHGGFSKMKKWNISTKNYTRFYLALVTESGVGGKQVPVYQSIFDFETPKPLQV